MISMAKEEQRKRRREPTFSAPRPCCPEHGDVMNSNGTRGRVTYYYCQHDGCGYSAKRPHGSIGGNNTRELFNT
jgi:hypothetical protein